MLQKTKKAFTLVELIVVITILVILGTIAFIAMNGYSKTARDSARISDMSKIRSSLELYFIHSNKYPDPTEAYPVTYSGGLAWYQGIFGNSTFMNVDKLDKIPTDPLTSKKYTYSVLNTGQEFEIASISEGNDMAIINNLDQVNAADKIARANISGTYNGVSLKVNANSTSYVLAVPSIITSIDLVGEEDNKDLVTIMSQKELVIDGYQNLPNNYIGSNYDSNRETENGDFTLVNNILVYQGDVNNLTPTDLVTNLQSSYSGTTMATLAPTQELFNIVLGSTAVETVDAFGTSFINNDLGGSVENIIYSTCDGIAHNTTKTFYSTGSIDFPEVCTDYDFDFVCINGTWTDQVTSEVIGDYPDETCTSVASNCSIEANYTGTTTHTYDVSTALDHTNSQNFDSNQVLENNGTFHYSVDVTCTDGILSNDSETGPILDSCDTNYSENGNICEPDVCEFGTSEFGSCLFGS